MPPSIRPVRRARLTAGVAGILCLGVGLTSAAPAGASDFRSVTTTTKHAAYDLETALSAAQNYYWTKDKTFAGMTDRANPGAIFFMGTGLSYSPEEPSTRLRNISTHIGSNGQWVVLAAWAPSSSTYYGMVFVESDPPATVAGAPITGSFGIYYFLVRKTNKPACDAATISSVSQRSTYSFPVGTVAEMNLQIARTAALVGDH